jgi:hypothetical protein
VTYGNLRVRAKDGGGSACRVNDREAGVAVGVARHLSRAGDGVLGSSSSESRKQ